MTIALIAHDSKKELMVQFCMAYRHILEQHRLLATGTTGRLVEENAGLKVTKFLPGGHGGAEQIVPVATNIATAEVLIHGLEHGDLDWRTIINPQR